MIGSQLAGDFLLPLDDNTKLGFIAGGIGVTPFRSHIQYLLDTNRTPDVQMFYCTNTVADIAYQSLWEKAVSIGLLRIVYVVAKEAVSSPYEEGFLDATILARYAPDASERRWYISGPPVMVNTYSRLLHTIGVPRMNIVEDFFPGVA
jgi:ferredoxin-NADP reductase